MHKSASRYVLALALVSIAARAEAVVEVTACNQLIPRGETGVLTNDLVCGTQYGVRLADKATLDLGDHTLSYVASLSPAWENNWAAVHCGATEPGAEGSSCRIIGAPGGSAAIVGDGSQYFGIVGGRVNVENLSVSGFALRAIVALGTARLTDVAVSDVAECAVSATKVRVTRVSAATSGAGICAYKLLSGADLSLVGNTSAGASAVRMVNVSGLTASANGRGVSATSVRLVDAILSDNGIDIAARRPPRIKQGSCETSRKMLEGPDVTSETWGVCSAD